MTKLALCLLVGGVVMLAANASAATGTCTNYFNKCMATMNEQIKTFGKPRWGFGVNRDTDHASRPAFGLT